MLFLNLKYVVVKKNIETVSLSFKLVWTVGIKSDYMRVKSCMCACVCAWVQVHVNALYVILSDKPDYNSVLSCCLRVFRSIYEYIVLNL